MKILRYLIPIIVVLFLLSACDKTTDPKIIATPQISPNGGTFTVGQTVTITTATDGATIKYTLDGTEPTATNGIAYTTPISVSSNKTIKAIAMKGELDNSAVATAVFAIFKDMVSIPGATFTMGRTVGTGYPDELPVHSVTLSKDFYMGKNEVTQAEWLAHMGTNPSEFVGMDKPVEMVSFYSVLVYMNKRSLAEGLTPVYTISGSTNPTAWGAIPTTTNATWNAATSNWNANGYRLPSEAEWEFAARGATNTPNYEFAGSDNVDAVAWYSSNAGAATHNVGTKAANGLGLFDMSGNVQEWVWDWHSLTYYASSPSVDPYGPATGTQHVLRGGSWEQEASKNRVAFRNNGTPDKGDQRVINSRLGFRVVRNAN